MIKKLIRHGNSYAIVIDKAIMELLNISPDTPLEITTDGESLFVKPLREKSFVQRIDGVEKMGEVNGRSQG